MNDESLLKDLELLQEVSDREVEAVKGGIILNDLPVGNCLACLSGIDPVVFDNNHLDVISEPSNLGLQSTMGTGA